MDFHKIFSQFSRTFRGFLDGIKFISDHGLSKFYVFPIVLTLLLWAGGFALIKESVEFISNWTYNYMELDAHPSGEGFFSSFSESWETIKLWINGASTVAVAVILKVVFWVLLTIITKYILLIILAPVLAYVSEKAENIITGSDYPFSMTQLTRDIWRGVLIALKNLMIEIGILILLAVVTLFAPYLAPLTALIGFVVGAYFYGYSMIDYIAERKRMPVGESSRFVWANAGLALGLGLFISLAMKVPFLGFLTASFASIVSAVAAVLLLFPQNSQKKTSIYDGVIELKKEI